MPSLLSLCPRPPDWNFAWDRLVERFAWLQRLDGCPQNPRYHAEGDVLVHTRLVVEALVDSVGWRQLAPDLREELFAAAVLHDVGKPDCTHIDDDGTIRSRGHAQRGEIIARQVLYRQGVEPERRERVCALVRHHMVPLYLRDSPRPSRQAATVSWSVRCDLLALLGRADALGRISDDADDLADRHRVFEAVCDDLGCVDRPYPFASPLHRFWFFRHPAERLEASPPALGASRVTFVVGLPGSGRRAWAQRCGVLDGPLLDLDALGGRYGVGEEDTSGVVVAEARQRARDLLRQGESFTWLETGLQRAPRSHLLDVFAEARAYVRLVHVERPYRELLDASSRADSAATELERLMDQWQVPDATEAHRVDRVLGPALSDGEGNLPAR
ncbi:MAG: AAA family ATPase [Acidobacteriota bacterium]